jgi:hypothetical protein
LLNSESRNSEHGADLSEAERRRRNKARSESSDNERERDDSEGSEEDEEDQEVEDTDVEEEVSFSPPKRSWSAKGKAGTSTGRKVEPAAEKPSKVNRARVRPAADKGDDGVVDTKRRKKNSDFEITYAECEGEDESCDIAPSSIIQTRARFKLGDRMNIQARQAQVNNLKKKIDSYSFETLAIWKDQDDKDPFIYNFPAKSGLALCKSLHEIFGQVNTLRYLEVSPMDLYEAYGPGLIQQLQEIKRMQETHDISPRTPPRKKILRHRRSPSVEDD